MNNHTNTKPQIYEKPRPRSNRNKVNSVHDSDSSARSPTSTSSVSDRRNCIFNKDTAGYGFKITGNAPVKVIAVRQNGSAWKSGLRENDIILKVNGESVIDKQHNYVVGLIRKQVKVELLVKSGDQMSTSFTHIPSKTNPISPPLYKKPQNSTKSPLKPLPVTNLPSSKDNLSPPVSSQGHISDNSARSTESINKSSDSASDCSTSTSSTEADYHSSHIDKNKPKNVKPIPYESNTVPNKIQNPKPEVAPKPNFIGSNFITNRNTPDQLNILKFDYSPDEDSPIKSHSYNAPSNTSSKLYQDSKKSYDNTRNKTIPSDGVKSNNMLSNGDDNTKSTVPQSIYSTLPKKLYPNKPNHAIQKSKSISNNGLLLGRDFDSELQDDENSDASITIVDLLSNTKDAISRPGLVAVLIQNANDQPNDLNLMMLYYACKYYKSFEDKKDFSADAPRLANEIITTFILEKSPVHVDVGSELVENILKQLRTIENVNRIFDALLKFLFQKLDAIVEKSKGKFQRGFLPHEFPKFGNETNKEMEMSYLHRTLCNILNKTAKDVDPSDSTLAKNIGLATIFQYFHKPIFSQGGNMRSRSTDGINTLGNQGKTLSIADLYKVNLFCSAYQQKIFSSIRKKPKTINGHSVTDVACIQPEDCSVCENVLWGPSPQGLFCTMCLMYFHYSCKKRIKAPCSKKSRKSIIISGNKEEKPSSTLFGRLSRKSSTTSVKNVNTQSIEVTSNVGPNIFNNNLIPDDKTSTNVSDENVGVFKAKSEDQLHRISNNSERFGSNNNMPSLSYNQSMDSNNSGSFQIYNGAVQIQELVSDESSNDPDMKVDESFDAGAEIQAVFPNIDPSADKKRLIVLLEFYHKTRYILMNLKRFYYHLVIKWPQIHSLYFKALSLDCVQPFVTLIKSLVNTIGSCIQEQDFVDLEKSIYNWLSENNDKRLKEWITLSSNLCCTNSLNIVKQLKQTTMRTIPDLIGLLNVKMHKMFVVEELTQIRPLLISLPLIVKNIIKCLTKLEPQYTDQLSVWKDVSVKMDYLCEYIDRCCVPLVDWINNGSIGKRIDRSDWSSRYKEGENLDTEIINYCTDFPRTLFHFQIFDFQIAKIFSWSRNTKRTGVDSRINYLKKGTEVLLIFYKSLIVVLQKENDHYYLKPIKPFKNISERLFPIIEINGFIATNGGIEEDFYILNIINKNAEDASLVRVGFTRKEFVENWMDYFNETHNLARSMSLYKLNDIKDIEFNNNVLGVKLRSSDSFSNTHASITPSVLLAPVQPEIQIEEPLLTESIVPESVTIPEEEIICISPTEIIEGLATASTIISNQKTLLTKFLKIDDEHYDNTLELVTKQGPKSLEDMTLMFYSLCTPMIDLTRQMIIAGSSKDDETININKIELKKTLTCISNLFQDLNLMNYSDEDNDNIKQNGGNKEIKKNFPSSVSRNELNSDLCALSKKNEMTPNEIIEEVKEIINEIVNKSVDQISQQSSPVIRQSYKYVPEKCLISAPRDNVERSSMTLTPTYQHLTNPIDDTITTTRAQIVLNRSSNYNL